MFLKASAMESLIFYAMKGACKKFCEKIIFWSIVAQDVMKTYFIFVYGAEYGAKCSAESVANI